MLRPRGKAMFARARQRLLHSPLLALKRDEAGSIAILAALVMPMVIGGLGLGAETGYWYLTQRKLQHAVDVSAHAAAIRKRAGDTKAKMDAAALNIATRSGYSPSVGTIVVNAPPLAGAKAGSADSVEVVLTHVQSRLLSAIFSSTSVTIRTRAVASVIPSASKACVLALAPTASGAVTVTGSTVVKLNGCDIASNSNAANSLLMSGSGAALTTGCAYAVGQAVTTAQLTLTQCAAVKEFAPVVRDPYASVAEPALVGACNNANVGTPNGNPITLTPTNNHPSGVKSMRFCNGLDLKGVVNFSPGLYIIEGGDLRINGGDANASSLVQLAGAGVTFYFASGTSMKLNSKATLNLTAPTSGPYSGILFFASRSSTGVTQQVNGSSSSVLQGAVYMPASPILLNGNSAATGGCTQAIGYTVTFSGNSTFGSTCAGSGTTAIESNSTVAIVE